MQLLNKIWKKITPTKALEQTSGSLETDFFETVYRLTYIEGISNSDHTLSYLLYRYSINLLLILLYGCEVGFFIQNLHSIDETIDVVNVLMIQIGAFCRFKNWDRKYKVFKSLASSMESPYFDLSTAKRKKVLNTWVTRNTDSLKLLIGLGCGTLIAWYGYPLADDFEYNLPVPIILPFDFCTPIRYFFTYIAIIVIFSYMSFFVMINDLIMQAHLSHILCQFDVLNDCFRNILIDCSKDFEGIKSSTFYMSDNFKAAYIKRLGDLVEQHKFVLNNTTTLRDMLSAPMLVQLGVSTSLLCSIGFQAVMSLDVNITKSIMGLLYLAYNMFVLFMICSWCEEIKTQSESIRDAVYCSGWECGIATLPGVRNRILLILARSNKPLVLSAGGMYDLSLAGFSKMVKTSYSALTVLLRFRYN